MPSPKSFEEELAREIIAQARPRAEQEATIRGDPPMTRRVSDEKELELWNTTAPGVDAVQLVVQGLSPEDATCRMYPYRKDLILRGHPTLREQVEYAKRMKRLTDEQQQAMGDHHV